MEPSLWECSTSHHLQPFHCLYHTEYDCKQKGYSGQGCELRHRRRCKDWGSSTGCFRKDKCQYLHVKVLVLEVREVEIVEEIKQNEDGGKEANVESSNLMLKVNYGDNETKAVDQMTKTIAIKKLN